MKRYVLTGAPGAGKTSVLRILQEQGFAVVAEAATDVIAREQGRGVDEPWQQDGFIDSIVALQRERLEAAAEAAGPHREQMHDRSVFCTLALARFLGRPVTPPLAAEVARAARTGVYQRAAFLIRPIGFIVPTAARRISYQESLEFERLHEAAYREHGFEVIEVAAAPVAERAAVIAGEIAARA